MQTTFRQAGPAASLWIHHDVASAVGSETSVYPPGVTSKVLWAELQLAMFGRTPRVKGTAGQRIPWRRTPVHGNHYYLYWVPSRVQAARSLAPWAPEDTILVRAIRHHDETSQILPLGNEADYERTEAAQLDPLYSDQRNVAAGATPPTGYDVRVVIGLPGSGKTVALHYGAYWIAKQAEDNAQFVLYVTYTDNLAKQAQAFFDACGVGHQVKVYTLGRLQAEIANQRSRATQPLADREGIAEFEQGFGEATKTAPGMWKHYLPALWIEIRAYLLGMALPFSWERQGVGSIPSGSMLDGGSYRSIRFETLTRQSAMKALELGGAVVGNERFCARCFGEQLLARRALDLLRESAAVSGGAFGNLRAIIVDELQDLTLVQIAFLAELGQRATQGERAFSFILAGDESQTVHPSGFDWGVTKDFLGSRLGARPVQFELHEQRRCPGFLLGL